VSHLEVSFLPSILLVSPSEYVSRALGRRVLFKNDFILLHPVYFRSFVSSVVFRSFVSNWGGGGYTNRILNTQY